jgi:hypothetical protein
MGLKAIVAQGLVEAELSLGLDLLPNLAVKPNDPSSHARGFSLLIPRRF